MLFFALILCSKKLNTEIDISIKRHRKAIFQRKYFMVNTTVYQIYLLFK